MVQWIDATLTKDCPINTQQELPLFEEIKSQPMEEWFEGRKFNPADIVVCSKFGIGKMVGVEHLDSLERSFFTIESLDQKMKNMIPVDSDILIRKVSTKNSFNKFLDKIAANDNGKDYECRKDRIADFQNRVRSNKASLGTILEVIKEIHALKDKGTVERQMMNELLDTVSREYSFVFECEVDEARKSIKKRLVQ